MTVKRIIILFLNLTFTCLLSCQNTINYEGKKTKMEYDVTQDSVWIETSNGKIFGLLFQPVGIDNSKLPAMLFLQGGGDVGLENYIYEAKFFAENGVISMVCDKSGSGLSETLTSWSQQSFKEKTDEYMEIFNWLSNHEKVDKEKVGVHGMSEGGRLALNMASRYPTKIAFVNAVSGPIVSFKENQLYAIYNYLQSQNMDSITITKTINVWDKYFDDIGNGKITEETIQQINELTESAPDLRYRPDNSGNLPSRPLSEDIHFTFEESIDRITCPVLLQYGKLDIIVDPIKSNSLIPKKPNFIIKNYIDTDHSMNLKNGDVQPLFITDKLIWIQGILN